VILTYPDEVYNRRMAKAASALVIRLPFFGYLLFGSGVKVVGDPTIETLATDGLKVYCGIEFVKTETIDITTFGLLHELIHVYFNHHGRREKRDPRTWNIAADIFTNGLCSELLGEEVNGKLVRWAVPSEFIQWQSWADGLTVEQIYEAIKKQDEESPGHSQQYLPKKADGTPSDKEIGNGQDMIEPTKPEMGSGDGEEDDPQNDQGFQDVFREDISRANALAEQSPLHKPLPTAVKSRMDKIMKPTLPWGALLRGNLSDALGWDEASYCPPKMKYYPIILPQTRSVKERKLVLGVDVSASVTDALIKIFITNVQAAAYRATEIIIVTFDAVVREVHRTKMPREIYNHVKFVSGAHSHTSAIDFFEIAAKERPSAICVLTDGHIYLPPAPVRNTTFVIPTGGKVLPWGKTFTMEHPWR
jgi:predicted metal-dependent peptidase